MNIATLILAGGIIGTGGGFGGGWLAPMLSAAGLPVATSIRFRRARLERAPRDV